MFGLQQYNQPYGMTQSYAVNPQLSMQNTYQEYIQNLQNQYNALHTAYTEQQAAVEYYSQFEPYYAFATELETYLDQIEAAYSELEEAYKKEASDHKRELLKARRSSRTSQRRVAPRSSSASNDFALVKFRVIRKNGREVKQVRDGRASSSNKNWRDVSESEFRALYYEKHGRYPRATTSSQDKYSRSRRTTR